MRCFRHALALGMVGGSVGAAEPALYFTPAALPALHARLSLPGYCDLWRAILADARKWSDPASSEYVNPAALIEAAHAAEAMPKAYHAPFVRDLSKWVETLGFAYQITGEERYGKHAASLLEAACDPAAVQAVQRSIFPGVQGDMMRGLALGLDLVSKAMTPEQRAKIVSVSRNYLIALAQDYAVPDSRWLTTMAPHNFSGVCGGAAGLLALALREDFPEEAPAWIDLGEKLILEWLRHGFDDQGAYLEGVLYLSYGISNPTIFADALWRLYGRKAILEHPRFRRIPYFLAMEMLPGETAFDARNDSLYTVDLTGKAGIGAPFLLPMATGFHGAMEPDPLAGWLWSMTRTRSCPVAQLAWAEDFPQKSPSELLAQPFGTQFKDRGLCVWRTGWSRSDVMFSVEAGCYRPITHNQADKGHFTLYGLGYRWAVDTGYANNKDPGGRGQTLGHSGILVDGKGQALSGAGLGTDGEVLKFENNKRYGYALVDCLPAYRANNQGMPGAPLTRALRHSFFVRPADGVPAYAVVLDDIEQEKSTHEFAWQLITWNDMAVAVSPGEFTIVPPGSSGNLPRMSVLIQASVPLTLSQEKYVADREKGRLPNDYLRLRAVARAENPRFVAVLAPLPPGTEKPQLEVERKEEATEIRVKWVQRMDRFLWSEAGARFLPADG